MTAHFISNIFVENLWHERSINLALYEDVNVIIGPNASGKTTIINLLMLALTGNIVRLVDYDFDSLQITLTPFSKGADLLIKVTKFEEHIRFDIGDRNVLFPQLPGTITSGRSGMTDVRAAEFMRRRLANELSELRAQLEGLVPAAWLPVNRRLPFGDGDDDERMRGRRGVLESVDECLSELLNGLKLYRVSLDTHLSDLRKVFQKHALENILYDERHDSIADVTNVQAPTQNQKKQLLKAFHDVGFVDSAMENRIDAHFKAAQEATEQIKRDPNRLRLEDLYIIPLIYRTKQMVGFAQDLETKRQRLFAPLNLYTKTVSDFLIGKLIDVNSTGELVIRKVDDSKEDIALRHLSSGEKQLLILLTQALLWERNPVVYVADEPELSLHVTWQEKLLKSITSLAGRCQIIVATHSPDIAGGFPNRIIDLSRL